ncbi:hypothetical protein [Streptomyces cucumeris]|uniref:hypothetical protein n=1 Tax=Streptomyces cucumeris TaxID=2962890 RepID=UPI0020C87332|nr:hypothetical protein [Streptomyces sp. NEAU-Y11]MCP9205505.1 hypothetical protein [Streptomyces sp. NEAU-Y11]
MGGPLKKYKVTSPNGVETVMKLNETDAESRGLSDADVVRERGGGGAVLSLPDDDHAPVAGEDGGEPGSGDGEDQAPEKKARPSAANKARTSSANKARTPRSKGGAGGGD